MILKRINETNSLACELCADVKVWWCCSTLLDNLVDTLLHQTTGCYSQVYFTMPPRRLIIPMWLKDVVRNWHLQEGLSLRQIQARLAEIGFHLSLSTIAAWFSDTHRAYEVLRRL